MLSDARPCPANIGAAKRHVRPHVAPSSDGTSVPSKRRVIASICSRRDSPRRVLITWDYGASGIWWVLTKEEKEAPAPSGRWTGTPPPGWHDRPRPWSDRLSTALLDDLQAWNDAWICDGADPWALQERGRELAARVQDELRTDGWEVLYQMGSQIVRVHPPGSWPVESWEQELLGYGPAAPESIKDPPPSER